MMLIFVQSFKKISQRVSELLGGHDIYKKFSKGHNSLKNVDGVMDLLFLFSAYNLVMLHICGKFHEYISKSFSVIEWTRFG